MQTARVLPRHHGHDNQLRGRNKPRFPKQNSSHLALPGARIACKRTNMETIHIPIEERWNIGARHIQPAFSTTNEWMANQKYGEISALLAHKEKADFGVQRIRTVLRATREARGEFPNLRPCPRC